MDPLWRYTFTAWSATADYISALRSAREEIATALSRSSRPLVAFSGGKDSTVLLHLVLTFSPDVTVLHWDYGPYYIPRSLHRKIVENAKAIGAKDLRIETSSAYRRLGRKAQNVMGRHLLGLLMPRLAEEGFDLVFVGLRKEESLRRRHRIQAGRQLTAIRESWPLQDWTWLDVWAYIVEKGLPYLRLYDKEASLIGYHSARFTTLFDPEFHPYGKESVDNVLHWRWRHLGLDNLDSSR